MFRGKTVYCNCDNPDESNFYRFFRENFDRLGLKKLIATGYSGRGRGTGVIFDGDEEQKFTLKEDGDFRSPECLEFLDEADVVVTNPPFSLFRDFMSMLVKHQKEFLVVGNMNAVGYKEIFPLIKDGELWLGTGDIRWFGRPGGEKERLGNVKWFTNLEHDKRNVPLELEKRYNPREYLKYDEYDAIEVSKVADIPVDYDGVMGVPISFLDKYCPEQFEIIDLPPRRKLTLKRAGRSDPFSRIMIKRRG